MHNGWSVVAGVHAVIQRITHHAFAQIAIGIGAADGAVERVGQIAAADVRILSDIQKDHAHARILADGHALSAGNLIVFQ